MKKHEIHENMKFEGGTEEFWKNGTFEKIGATRKSRKNGICKNIEGVLANSGKNRTYEQLGGAQKSGNIGIRTLRGTEGVLENGKL